MVSLYYLDVSQLDFTLEQDMLSLLSEYRRQKVAKMKAENARKLSLGAGLAIDYGLRKYGLRESQMRYSFGSNNKPYFENHPSIFFNVSHSHSYVMAAFSDSEIGCDIEKIGKARLAICNRFFSEEEKKLVNSESDEALQNKLFYKIWTLKESFVKYSGKGLQEDFRNFNVLQEGFAGENIRTYEYMGIEGYYASCCYEEVKEKSDSFVNAEIIKVADLLR